MRHAIVISLVALGSVIAVVIGAWIGLFHTPPGREFLEEIVESQLGGALDSRADVGALKGGLPGHIILDGVALWDPTSPDDADPWLSAEKLELRWRPFALLRKRIIIDEAVLTGADLKGAPPEGETQNDEARQFKIFGEAPHIDIRRLVVDGFTARVNGVERRIDGGGAVRLDGPEIALALNLSSRDGADEADILFDKSPSQGHFKLDATIKGAPGGALTTLIGLEGPLSLHAAGDGPVNEAPMTIAGAIGGYGDIEAQIVANFDGFDGADIKLSLAPGPRLNSVTELSGPVALDARYDVKNRGGALAIRKLTSALGEIEGGLRWRAPRGFVDRLNVEVKAQLAEDYRPEIQEIAGDELALKAVLDWRRDDYALKGTLAGPLATLTLENGATDLRHLISGDARLEAGPRDNAPVWLEDGFVFEAGLDADFETRAEFTNARFETGGGARFTGAGAYGFEDDSLALKGDIILPAEVAEKLAPGTDFSGAVTGDIDLSGPLDLFTLNTAFETPAIKMNDSTLPPMNAQAALSGLPRYPNGEVKARAANDAPRRLEVRFRSSEDGTVRLPQLLYAGRGFELKGTGRVEPDRQTVNLDLAYEGDKDAEPWPGVNAAGDLAIKGVLSREGALSKMQASAGRLRVNEIAVSGAEATAEGPPGAMELTVSSDSVTTPQAGAITGFSARGQFNARGAPTLTLTAFEAVIRDNRAELTAPARFDFEDGVDIRNLRMNWGKDGVISLDGGFSETRWRADAAFTNANIPGADSQVTATVALDTEAETPGRGEFYLRSLLVADEEASIDGRLVWDGETLRLTDRGDEKSLEMDVRLPAKLVKTPALSVDTSEELDGRVRYEGDIQALAAYMPPVLQSVEGDLAADFRLSGTLEAPDLSGRADLADGAYTEIESGFSLDGLHAEAQASYGGGASALTFKGGASGAGQSRKDTITFNGDLTLGEESKITLAVKLDGAELSAHPVNKVRADGDLSLSGPLGALKAEGEITVAELDAEIASPESTGLVDIEVIAYNDEPQAAQETEAAASEPNLDYDIHVSADDRIFIRGRGLESEWSADVNAVTGREAPLVLGSLSLRRGWVDFSGRRFDLTRGSVDFDRLAPNNPRIDIRAELSTADITAVITVSGRADDPDIELTSTPSMPSEDIMAFVLFGKPAQELSETESAQAALALASLSGIGPFGGGGGGITGKLRRAVGLDLLNIDVDPQSGGGSLTVGKYVAEGFFVSASQDAEGRNGSVSVKYEITDNIVVETELEQNGDQTVSANWKKDF
ncbi:translocation/assembly module TamB domain-containing protein [Hyphococcus luteus]|uniref:Translocation and assembly module TamB C-terminal domain-containing protein n=1 Tax=Hyphococcus luteus TaxID=2058213 RepID=A0A2S7JZ98_9PROT|nr:translocation/assembly module TamB domain-containing protein [Marinicaulis flavus]PQA85518.1 hypothetical protein CW354_21500 [Marinicaulis flavus]